MPYPIVNRRGGARNWRAFNPDDGLINGTEFGEHPEWTDPLINSNHAFWGRGSAAVSFDHGTIPNNQSRNPQLHYGSMLLFITGATTVGPWTVKNGDHLVITPNGGGSDPGQLRHVLVSVEAAAQHVNNNLKGYTTEPAPGAQQDDTTERIIGTLTLVASVVLGSLSTAFSASGPTYAASAGAAGLAAGLIGGIAEDGGGVGLPPSPTTEQIEALMRKVTDVTEAEKAATHFVATYAKYRREGRNITGTQDISPKKLEDLRTDIRRSLNASDNSEFAHTLTYVRDTPRVCKYILPQYMLAAGLYLTLSRTLIGMTNFPESKKKPQRIAISAEEIEDFLEDTKKLRAGLEKAQKEFVALRNTHVASSGLSRTPEAIVPMKIVSKHYFGDEYAVPDNDYATKFPKGSDFLANVDLTLRDSSGTYTIPRVGQGYSAVTKADPIRSALDKLDSISKSLEEDLATVKAGGWPTHLLNIDWDAEA